MAVMAKIVSKGRWSRMERTCTALQHACKSQCAWGSIHDNEGKTLKEQTEV